MYIIVSEFFWIKMKASLSCWFTLVKRLCINESVNFIIVFLYYYLSLYVCSGRNISWTVVSPPWWWPVRRSIQPSDRTTSCPPPSSVTSTNCPRPRASPVSTRSTRRCTSSWPPWLPIRKSFPLILQYLLLQS